MKLRHPHPGQLMASPRKNVNYTHLVKVQIRYNLHPHHSSKYDDSNITIYRKIKCTSH